MYMNYIYDNNNTTAFKGGCYIYNLYTDYSQIKREKN